MARAARVSAQRRLGWLRFGAPAAVSVVLGVVAGIWVSRASAARPGRLIGWTGPLAARRPSRIRQGIGTVEPCGEVIGADIRGEATGTPPPR